MTLEGGPRFNLASNKPKSGYKIVMFLYQKGYRYIKNFTAVKGHSLDSSKKSKINNNT